jgi:hypothetical protein
MKEIIQEAEMSKMLSSPTAEVLPAWVLAERTEQPVRLLRAARSPPPNIPFASSEQPVRLLRATRSPPPNIPFASSEQPVRLFSDISQISHPWEIGPSSTAHPEDRDEVIPIAQRIPLGPIDKGHGNLLQKDDG